MDVRWCPKIHTLGVLSPPDGWWRSERAEVVLGGCCGLLGLLCFPLADVFQVSDAFEQTPRAGRSHLLKADGQEG